MLRLICTHKQFCVNWLRLKFEEHNKPFRQFWRIHLSSIRKLHSLWDTNEVHVIPRSIIPLPIFSGPELYIGPHRRSGVINESKYFSRSHWPHGKTQPTYCIKKWNSSVFVEDLWVECLAKGASLRKRIEWIYFHGASFTIYGMVCWRKVLMKKHIR